MDHMVSRSFLVDPNRPFGTNMVAHGLCNRFDEPAHGWELITVNDKPYCLGCFRELLSELGLQPDKCYTTATLTEEEVNLIEETSKHGL